MQQVYLKRMTKQDITKSVTICTESVESFWGVNPEDANEYTPIRICHEKNPSNFPEGITIHKGYQGEKDWRITGKYFKSLYSDDNPQVGDIMQVIKIADNTFVLSINKKGSRTYELLSSFFKGSDNYVMLTPEVTEDFDGINEIKEDNLINVSLEKDEYEYMAAIRTKPFLILGGFSGTGKSIKVKELAFATCPCDGVLNVSETSPGNYLLVSVKPNWHDATDITGFRSSVNRNYYVTDFMRFLVKAKLYEDKKIPFFVCLDEMNLAPVEEYFAEFLSVIESRKKRKDGKIVTDAIVPASVFSADDYSDDFNIFMSLGLELTNPELKADSLNEYLKTQQDTGFVRQDIVDELKRDGLTIPQNVIIIGTVNMDDTTNTFSRKVIDRAMTFETVVGEFGLDYFDSDISLSYVDNPISGDLFISDEVRASETLDEGRFILNEQEKRDIISFVNNINDDLKGTPFKISYRILNETILYYRSRKVIEKMVIENGGFDNEITFAVDLNTVFDDILMQKILPRIEGDSEKCNQCLQALLKRAKEMSWKRSEEKINFMINRFGRDNSGFTSFWN